MSATASSSSSTPKLTPVAPIRLVSCFYDSSPDSSPISSPTSASPILASPPPLPTSPHVSFLPDRDFQNLLLPTHPEALHKVVQYVEDNWINSNIWDPSCWSVFGRAVRTNNDTEGWHHHLNILCEKIGHNNINLYELIEVLHREAGLVCNQCQLVGEEKLKRYQRLKYQTYQEKIFTIWDDYRQKKITPRKLLEEISQHHRPADIH